MPAATTNGAAARSWQHPITLVVAATHASLGIGRAGTLPWKLPTDMAFFKHVTSAPHHHDEDEHDHDLRPNPVVIMGRKSWDSIPARFRPLRDRTNVVLSRTVTNFGQGVLAFSSLSKALAGLSHQQEQVIYIIGGAQVYEQALSLPQVTRIFLTVVYDESESDNKYDTFLPEFRHSGQWVQKSHNQLRAVLAGMRAKQALALVPEQAGHRLRASNGLEYEFTLWERAS
ncbi:dihydrofolate reductase-like domain-containing protein [Lipomyces japonicus]|uniref:dihydrofolate reductase-like domain-containing protein n=1 Tax=Lipomyces japonicus TaxID=56871 RepID=UPI0034CD638C